MLSITHKPDVEKVVEIGALFDELGVPAVENAEMQNEFGISVLSSDGFRHVEGFRRSEKLAVWKLFFEGGHLDAAGDHLLRVKAHDGSESWKRLRHIQEGIDCVKANDGWRLVTGVGPYGIGGKVLFDLQVQGTHSFYTGGILSHNSHFLVQLGSNAIRAGKNVLHYTFELSEKKVGIRYDSNLTNVGATDVPDEKEFILSFYGSDRAKDFGRLIIKDYPTNTATVNTLKAHIEKLVITKGFRPDVIIIDYADIMRSTRQFDSLRHELKLVYEELRGLAMELRTPVWTASQTNRESTESEVVGLDKISESFGKAMVCDFIISLSRRPLQKSKGLCNLFIPKNRLGKDGILFPARIDTARSLFDVLEHDVDVEDFQRTADNGMKQLVNETWKEVSNDRLMQLRSIDRTGMTDGGEG